MNKLDLYRTLKHSETNGVVDAFACNCNKYKERVHDSQTHIHFMYCVVVAMMLLITQKKNVNSKEPRFINATINHSINHLK